MSPSVIRGSIAFGVILVIGIIVATARSRQSAADADAPPAVYICRESKEVFYTSLPLTDMLHPGTGRATLAPAVYCPQCAVWQPAPPAERRYGNPQGLLCPKCKSPRSFTGDLPEDAGEL
jgi:hypothetical protein